MRSILCRTVSTRNTLPVPAKARVFFAPLRETIPAFSVELYENEKQNSEAPQR